MILQNPVRNYGSELSAIVLSTLRRQVDERGICLPDLSRGRRRPSTICFSVEAGDDTSLNIADSVWSLASVNGGPSTVVLERDAKWQPAVLQSVQPFLNSMNEVE